MRIRKYSFSALIFLGLLFYPLFCYLGKVHWIFDLFTHFRLQFIGLSFVVALGFLFMNAFKRAGLALVIGLLALWTILPYLRTFQIPNENLTNAKTIKILHSNLYTLNEDHRTILEVVKKENPDVLVFLEVGREWFKVLRMAFKEEYELLEYEVREDHFGMAVFSKIPKKTSERIYLGQANVPTFRIVLDHDGEDIAFWATHPYPPKDGTWTNFRNEHLQLLAQRIEKEFLPVILAGDLNTSPWSRAFHLLKTVGLRDSSLSFGLRLTWYSFWPAWMRVPIDFVLISKEFQTRVHRKLPFIGSDHFPILVELSTSHPRA